MAESAQTVQSIIGAFASIAIAAFSTQPASAEFKSEWQIIEFASGQTLVGVTVKDRESWSVRMNTDGSFRMQYSNGRIDRGRWVVKGRKIQFLFDRGDRSTCRMFSVDAAGSQGWHDCKTGHATSIILSPKYDSTSLDGANERKAAIARQAQGHFRGIQRNMPRGGQGAAIVGELIDLYMDAKIAQLLSPEGRRLHASAAQRAWVTGQPQVWTNPDANEGGRVTPGKRTVDANGQVRQFEKAEVYKDGRVYESEREVCFGPDGVRPCS